MPDQPTHLEPGVMLAERFRLCEQVDRGGSGEVWLAQDTKLDDGVVACKLLRPDFMRDPRAIADLKREVLLTRRLRHPNIRAVYTFFEDGERRFITMEYIEGRTLATLLQDRGAPIPPEEAIPWAGQLCDALDYAHHAGVLHRDIKPANILIDGQRRLHLADFGIARTLDALDEISAHDLASGTLMYMSPEQLCGDPMQPASDQYSLGVTIYELLGGCPPFSGSSLVAQVQLKPAPALKGAPDAVNAVLLRALAKEPSERFQSCVEFFETLADAAAGKSFTVTPAVSAPPFVPGIGDEADTVRLAAAEDHDRLRLGRLLVEEGLLSMSALEETLAEQESTGLRLGELLIASGRISEGDIARALAKQVAADLIVLATLDDKLEAAADFTLDEVQQYLALPIVFEDDTVLVAMADPLRIDVINSLEARYGRRVQIAVCTRSALLQHAKRLIGRPRKRWGK